MMLCFNLKLEFSVQMAQPRVQMVLGGKHVAWKREKEHRSYIHLSKTEWHIVFFMNLPFFVI